MFSATETLDFAFRVLRGLFVKPNAWPGYKRTQGVDAIRIGAAHGGAACQQLASTSQHQPAPAASIPIIRRVHLQVMPQPSEHS